MQNRKKRRGQNPVLEYLLCMWTVPDAIPGNSKQFWENLCCVFCLKLWTKYTRGGVARGGARVAL